MGNFIYYIGDTDSVFFTFNLQSMDGIPIRGKQALEITIELAQEAGKDEMEFLNSIESNETNDEHLLIKISTSIVKRSNTLLKLIRNYRTGAQNKITSNKCIQYYNNALQN